MVLRYPSYYDKFHCIAGRCEDTCCAGWEIDIDDDSYQYYMSVEGEFGERLRENIREYAPEDEDVYESHGFVLQENRRCPFLNEENLCDIYTALGEAALCDVCTNTPRNILEYGGERELAISASCAEAGRLIYGEKGITTFVEKEIEDILDVEETEEEKEFACYIRIARDEAIRILQNRELSVYQRIRLFLSYAQEVQECLNQNVVSKISEIVVEDFFHERDKFDSDISERMTAEKRYELFLQRMLTFTEMESINAEWQNMLLLLQNYFITPEQGRERYESAQAKWQEYLSAQGREFEYEHLMVYYVFMCLARCVDDYDFIGKAKLAVVSFLMIRDMDAVWYLEKGENCRREDRIMMARIYAKEVEHSEENLGFLAEEFLFEDCFCVNNLSGCV